VSEQDDLMCPRCKTIFSVYEAHMKYLTGENERLTTGVRRAFEAGWFLECEGGAGDLEAAWKDFVSSSQKS